jgi:hypothetical protein
MTPKTNEVHNDRDLLMAALVGEYKHLLASFGDKKRLYQILSLSDGGYSLSFLVEIGRPIIEKKEFTGYAAAVRFYADPY